jgi:hypothetical protein
MEPGQIFVVIVVAIVTSGVTLGMIAHAWAESRKRGAGNPQPRLDAIDARLSRMEEMIETVAIEMERVAEGQRFTAKLLADRTEQRDQLPLR